MLLRHRRHLAALLARTLLCAPTVLLARCLVPALRVLLDGPVLLARSLVPALTVLLARSVLLALPCRR